MSGRTRLKPEREDRAVAGSLCLYIGKAPATHSLGARNIGGRNLHIEAIAATIGFVIGERLIGTDRDA